MLNTYRYVFELLDSNMYILIEDNDAIIIDPHLNEDVEQLLLHHSIKNVDIILTHEHFDHVSGATKYSKTARNVIANTNCKKVLENPNNRINSRFAATFIGVDEEKRKRIRYVCNDKVLLYVNKSFDYELYYQWHQHDFYLKSTAGHSPGSICIIMDNKILFTGDSLIPHEDVVTRFPGGSMEIYDKDTRPFLDSLDKQLLVYPGHGEVYRLGELI